MDWLQVGSIIRGAPLGRLVAVGFPLGLWVVLACRATILYSTDGVEWLVSWTFGLESFHGRLPSSIFGGHRVRETIGPGTFDGRPGGRIGVAKPLVGYSGVSQVWFKQRGKGNVRIVTASM